MKEYNLIALQNEKQLNQRLSRFKHMLNTITFHGVKTCRTLALLQKSNDYGFVNLQETLHVIKNKNKKIQ